MSLMALGLFGLAASALLAYLTQRHRDLLRLQAQVLQARLVLDQILRERRELVEVWCSLCEERGLLLSYIPEVRKGMLPLRAKLSRVVSEEGEQFSDERWSSEKKFSRLVRESYAAFLEQMPAAQMGMDGSDGPSVDGEKHRDFFQQYFRSLTRLETEMGDAYELYNDSVRVFNRALEGWTGWYFRRWERLRPKPILPALYDDLRFRRFSEEPVPALNESVVRDVRVAGTSLPASKI